MTLRIMVLGDREKTGTCMVCGKEFKYYASNRSGNYCSRKCFHFHLKGVNHPRYKDKIQVTCEQCGKDFTIKPSLLKSKRFCSYDCLMKWESEEWRGKNNPNWKGGDIERICQRCGRMFKVAQRHVKAGKGLYCSNICRLKAIGSSNPTKEEAKLASLLHKHNLPFKYAGDIKIAIGKGSRHSKYPDFINEEKRQVIELFGSYWHSPLLNPNTPASRTYGETIKHYKQNGYNCLILWDTELNKEGKVLEKIKAFMGMM